MVLQLEEFLQAVRRRAPQATTARHYQGDVTIFFTWCAKAPQDVTRTDIDRFIEWQQSVGLAVATINRRLIALRQYYGFLADHWSRSLACPVVPRLHYIHQGRQLPRDAKDETVTQLFAQIQDPRDLAMFTLMLRCGLRVSEVATLNLDDVFFRNRAEQASRLRIHGKRQTERVVFLSEQVEQRVRAYLAMRPAAQDRALFLNRYGVHLSVTAVQKRLTHYAEQAGLHLTCHQLRHVFSRQLIEVGMPVTSLQALLGHRSLRTTRVYVHLADPLVRRDYFESMHRITGDEAANPGTLAQPGQNLAEASSSGTPRGGRSERRAA
ncbi:MAG: tyrosine-type recombinase/integrase [Chloroflexi bacterium]|nr:tyrosine-type recombinase/integrase [Chloroflexota bacterium]